jgi:hypothetical protein
MSRRGRDRMAIRPETLQTPERGMALTDRGPAAPLPPEDEPGGDEREMFMARLEVARRVEPLDRDLHCRDCFRRGRDAAVRAIEGD